MRRNATLGSLVVFLLLAFGLRLVNLGTRTLWYDEAFAVFFAQTGLEPMLYGTLTPVEGGASDIHPLLYYTLLNYWMRAAGQSPVAVRMFSVLVAILTIAVVYRVAFELFDRRVAATAVLVTSLAPFHIQYAQETRMYALMALLLLSATWCYLRAWRGGGRGWWLAFGVLAALAMYTQQLAAFYLAALGLTPMLAKRWQKVPPTALGAGVAIALYIPWLVNLPGQLDKLQSYYWIERPSLLRPLLTLRSFAVVALDLPVAWNLPTFFVGVVLLVFLILQIGLRWRRMRRKERMGVSWLLWLAFGSLVLMWFASQVLAPVYLDRALLVQAVMVYIACAWMFVRGSLPKAISMLLILLWAGVALAGYVFHVSWDQFPNSPFDQAVNWLEAASGEGGIILHSNKLTMLPMAYYARQKQSSVQQAYLLDRPGSPEDTLATPTQEVLGLQGKPCVAEAAGGASPIWFVIFEQEEQQYVALPGYEEHPHLDWLRAHYTEGETVRFNDLLIIPFSDPVAYDPVCSESSQ